MTASLARDGTAQHRVLVISYLFPPSMEMGAQACAQIVRYLPRYGWTPVVLTVRERHVGRSDPRDAGTAYGPLIRTGMVTHPFAIYRCLRSWLGAGVHPPRRAHAPHGNGADGSGLLHRILSLLAVPDTYSGWIPPAIAAGLGGIRRYRIEHLFSSGPPWTSHVVGLALARLSGLPWTAHFRDPWIGPRLEMARLKPVSALSLRLEQALERMVVARADVVVCVTEEHAAALRRTYGQTAASKFLTIPNGFDGAEWEDLTHDGKSQRLSRADSFVITYAGALYNRRSPAPLLRAVKTLIDGGRIARDRVRIDLLGWCEVAEGRRVRELAAECGLDSRVRLTGPVARRDTLQQMMRSDLLLLLAEGLTVQVPGKTYEYLRAGRPILALAPQGAVSRLLRHAGGAWVVDPKDEAGIANVLCEAYRSWSEGGNLPAPDPAVVAGFDRRFLAGRFAELFGRPRPESQPDASFRCHA